MGIRSVLIYLAGYITAFILIWYSLIKEGESWTIQDTLIAMVYSLFSWIWVMIVGCINVVEKLFKPKKQSVNLPRK